MRMGHFHVAVRLTGPSGRNEDLSMLVDTGATFLVVAQAVADQLELRPSRTCRVELADGREQVWPLAEVRLRLGDLEVTTPCLICSDGPALLGVVALESLLLAVDPVARRLVPVKGFVCAA